MLCCCGTVVTFTYFFNILSGYNLLLQPQKNMTMKSSRLKVAWNAICQEINNRKVIQVHEARKMNAYVSYLCSPFLIILCKHYKLILFGK